MEKFKAHKGGKATLTSLRFTPEEQQGLKAALGEFPEDTVELFINGLEVHCIYALRYMKDRSDFALKRKERERVLRRFEKTQKELGRLLDKKTSFQEKADIFDGEIHSPETVFEKESLHWLMVSVSMQLKVITEKIQDGRNKAGRPVTVAGDLVEKILIGFEGHFGRPSGYSNPNIPTSGPFFAVVQIALEACGLPAEDPSRHIKKALKTL